MNDNRSIWGVIAERARLTPTQPFTVAESGETLTFGVFCERAERVAAALAAMGIGRGDRVAWQLPTWTEALLLSAALCRLGAVQAPLLPLYREREVAYICGQIGARWLFAPRSWKQFDYGAQSERVARSLGLRFYAVQRGGLPEAETDTLPPWQAEADNPARWIFCTSGTTAEPKAALHGDQAILSTAFGMNGVLELGSDDAVGLVFPFTHIGGILWFVSIVLAGARCLLVEFFGDEAIDFLRREQVTVAGAGTPFHLAYLKAQRREPSQPLFAGVRCFPGGGAPKAPELHRDLKRELGGVGIVSGYGMTECPIVTMNSVRDPDTQLAQSEGRPLPGMEIRIVADGARRAAGETGEIWVRGPHRCLGYVDAALNEGAFDADGFFRTGDLGYLDAGGWLVITGRVKDVIIRKGENISAKKIEDVLYSHPRIADAAVVGLRDAERGERVCAVLVLAEGADALSFAELAAFCRDGGLMQHEIPEQLEFCGALPRTSSGKVLKQQLQERYAR